MTTQLRPYQEQAIADVRAALAAGSKACCLVLPTGAGKTAVGVEMARRHLSKSESHRVLWLAHRTELVAQSASRFVSEGIEAGIIAAGVEGNPTARVQVASTQTLLARGETPPSTMVILDEAHHYVSDEWSRLAGAFPNAVKVGLTATPERSDGKPLGDMFDSLVTGPSIRELTDMGFLVPCEVLAPSKRLKRQIAGDPLERYLAVTPGKRAFVFAANVADAAKLCDGFNAGGVPSALITAETPAEERRQAIERFRDGELLALHNVYVLTEGTDIPSAEVCILARGFGCASTYLQCIGRVLRPSPGKERAVVLDLCGASRRHGVPSDDREYSLDGGIALVRNGKARSTQEAASVDAGPVEVIDAQLELNRGITVALGRWSRGCVAMSGAERDLWFSLGHEARRRGYKPGWMVHQFKEKTGRLPWEPPVVEGQS